MPSVKVLVPQLRLTLCHPKGCSLPSSSIHGISQARILEWVVIPFFRGIFPTQGSKPGLPHCGQILYLLSHQGINYFSTGDSFQNGNTVYREPYHKRKDAWTYTESSDFLFFFPVQSLFWPAPGLKQMK